MDSEISYLEQQVAVPPSSPYLAYWHWIASADDCGFDFAKVIVNGSAVTDLYDLCNANNTNGWVKHAVDLSAYAGLSVSIRIQAETDSSLNSNLFVDDVAFQATAAGPASSNAPDRDSAIVPAKAEPRASPQDTANPAGPKP
jgi:kumamolisin